MPDLPTSEELEASLWRGLLDAWFPVCLDPEGGYRQNFDAAFQPTGDSSKGIVFQARMVWVCATVAPLRPEFREYAQHGVRFLLDRMARPDGAFQWSVGSQGTSTDEVHAYGMAFAVYALAAAARHLGDGEALAAAQRAFAYLERAHWDGEHGGYFEASVDGSPRLKGPWAGDAIGTPYGQKSQNTHLHLMEAFTELFLVWPDPLLRERLAALVEIFTDRLFAPTEAGGHLTLFTEADWRPTSGDTSYGHDIEAAHLLLAACDALGGDAGLAMERACALADHTLARGWDAAGGGIFYLGDEDGPTDHEKVWWAEAEALLGFATLWKRTGDPRYAEATAQTWAFIRDQHIDAVHGGWFEEAGQPETAKGHSWKAAYHDGRALLFTSRLLKTA